jgi:hypothetical protein
MISAMKTGTLKSSIAISQEHSISDSKIQFAIIIEVAY